VLVSAADLAGALPAIFTSARLAKRAVRVGLVGAVDADRFVVRSPALVQLAAELDAAGMAPTAVLDYVESILAAAAAVAEPSVALTVAHLAGAGGGGRAGGAPGDGDDAVAGTVRLLQRTRGLLAQAVATAVVNQVGAGLDARTAEQPAMVDVLAGVRIGQVRDATSRSRR
jgi:hypothetical protein